MNPQLYHDIFQWLYRKEMRSDIGADTKRILNRASKEFEIQQASLFKKRGDILLSVIQEGPKKDEIMRVAHDHPLAGHMGRSNTYNRINNIVW
jgi:hypothetical protein